MVTLNPREAQRMPSEPAAMTNGADWTGRVLRFWFEEVGPLRWFIKDDALDGEIRDRFGALHSELSRMAISEVPADPRQALAAVIVLDQFSRNMFRGTAGAFASDAAARAIAVRALELGLDQHVRDAERLFFYLPFEHSENAADQERSVALISALGDAELTRYALAHQAVISRFGRFPHRNEILGRPSTAEEVAFLNEPGSSF